MQAALLTTAKRRFCYPEATGQNAARPEHLRHERGNVRRGITLTACPHGSPLSFVALILCNQARRAPGEGLIGIAGGHFAGLMPIWRQKQCDTHLMHRSQVVSPSRCAPILRGAPWGCWRDGFAGKPQGGTSPDFCTYCQCRILAKKGGARWVCRGCANTGIMANWGQRRTKKG